MIKAIIFDLNGVFIQAPYLSDRFKERFGVPTEDFLPVLKEIMEKVRKPGAGDCFVYWKPYLKKWGVSLSREQFFNFWFKEEKPVPKMIELGKQLKQKGIKLFLLSNNFLERTNYYRENFPFLEQLFNKIYYSYQTGFVKPDPEAFKKILSDNNLNPKECLYFDNSEENIETANGLGIKSFFFKSPDSAKKIIEQELN